MSELGDKQRRFVYMVAQLIIYAYDELGWELSFAEAYRDPRATWGSRNTLHSERLAIDLNLFVNDEYIDGQGTSDQIKREYMLWERLGIFWEKLGGTWGGRFTTGPNAKDLNHFSIAHAGKK